MPLFKKSIISILVLLIWLHSAALRSTSRAEEPATTINHPRSLSLEFKINSRIHNNTTRLLRRSETTISQRPTLQDSVRSLSRKFILHFDRTGIDAVPSTDASHNGVPDFIDSASVIFDQIWIREIDEIGFQPPLNKAGQPVDTYHVYFVDQTDLYGKTVSETEIPIEPNFSRYTSYTILDNDFSEAVYYVQNLTALRVIAAHEFNHAIQLSYGVHWDQGEAQDVFFMEMTSTWLEGVLFPKIKRYFENLPPLFDNFSNTSITNVDSLYPYANALFLKMLDKEYGEEMILDIWETIKTMPSIAAIEKVLLLYDTSLLNQLHQYAIWLNFTGDKADGEKYFPDGRFYPDLKYPFNSTYRLVDDFSIATRVAPLSSRLLKIKLPRVGDYASQLRCNSAAMLLGQIYLGAVTDKVPTNQSVFFTFTPETEMNVIITNAGVDTMACEYALYKSVPRVQQNVLAFPNPVKPHQDREVVFINTPNDAEIAIYSSQGYRIRRLNNSGFSSRITWDLKNDNGLSVSTGVYLYVVKNEGVMSEGKIVVVR